MVGIRKEKEKWQKVEIMGKRSLEKKMTIPREAENTKVILLEHLIPRWSRNECLIMPVLVGMSDVELVHTETTSYFRCSKRKPKAHL